MKKTLLAMTAAAIAAFPAFAEAEKTDADAVAVDRVERTKKLVGEFKDSVAMVAVYLKAESDGSLPQFSIPYVCPNCSSTHYRNADDYIKENRPFLCAGFILANDEVLMQDLSLRPKWIDRIEVRFGKAQTKYPAAVSATFPTEGGVLLKTDKPIEGAKPLEFVGDGKLPESPVYFYLVKEAGFSMAGIKDSAAGDFRHFVELDRDIARGVPNTIVVDENDRPVTVAMQTRFDLGGEVMTPPSEWKRAAADAGEKTCAAVEESMASSILPVFIRLDAKEKTRNLFSTISLGGMMDDEKIKDENDTCGYLIPGGELLIPLKMNADETSRISKMEATLPDGTKCDLEFVGSLEKYGAIVARFEGDAPAGLKPFNLYNGAITDLFLETVVCASRKNVGGKLVFKAFLAEVGEFSVGFDEKLVFDPQSGNSKADLVFTTDGRLVSLGLSIRAARKRYGDTVELVYGDDLGLVASGKAAYNGELVPRTGEDRIRTAWLGVEVQQLTESIAREKKATAFLHTGTTDTEGSLVSKVYPGTSAAELGIKEGDVLLDVRIVGTEMRKGLETENYGIMAVDWNEVYEKAPLDLFEQLPVTPWPSVGGGINGKLTELGIGERVIVAWVSDGVRKEGETVLQTAPTYFNNAPKARNKSVGLLVKDMTFEVRGYFRFEDGDSGVVIAKVKPGSPAAIAGLKPYEIVTEVDGAPVADAKAFSEALKDKKEATFSVRRLTATRMVKVTLK